MGRDRRREWIRP